jgi:hypothetical protein
VFAEARCFATTAVIAVVFRGARIFMDDEVIGLECSSFAALHESGSGTNAKCERPL